MLKLLHIGLAALTFASFITRGIFMLRDSSRRHTRFWRVAPHVIDTLLLTTGILLALRIRQYPLTHDWLTAKIAALAIYIALGVAALRGRTHTKRLYAWLAALAVFAYIVAVAAMRSALPWSSA